MNINEIINKIVWWIPFKKLRNAVREYLLSIYYNIENIYKQIDNYDKKMSNRFLELKNKISLLDLRNKVRMQILALEAGGGDY